MSGNMRPKKPRKVNCSYSTSLAISRDLGRRTITQVVTETNYVWDFPLLFPMAMAYRTDDKLSTTLYLVIK